MTEKLKSARRRHHTGWLPRDGDDGKADSLSRALGISPLTARLLVRRGVADPDDARRFLGSDRSQLSPPESLPGMAAAVSRLSEALARRERILVYGDYDADGICGASILWLLLERLGAALHGVHLPNRLEEGYGLHPEPITNAAAEGYNLILTVDCGISAVEEVALGTGLGLDFVITDHHELPPVLPESIALVNPRCPGTPAASADLSGAGVAYLLAEALAARLGQPGATAGLLELAALGTVADQCLLLGDNRILVREGMEAMKDTCLPGLRALVERTVLSGGGNGKKNGKKNGKGNGPKISTWHLAFLLAPRLNAAGRVGRPEAAFELLTTRDYQEGVELVSRLEEANRRRQELEQGILAQAQVQASEQRAGDEDVPFLLLDGEGWHPGVIGIVASRMVDTFQVPAALVSLSDGEGRGSARSVPGFDLYRAFDTCRHLLERFGGHTGAVGFTIRDSEVPRLRQALRDYTVRGLQTGEFTAPALLYDLDLPFHALGREDIRELERLEPYGPGNPEPIFRDPDTILWSVLPMGSGEHLRFQVRHGCRTMDGVAFSRGADAADLAALAPVDILYRPEIDDWKGQERLRMKMIQWRPSAVRNETLLYDLRGAAPREGILDSLSAAPGGCRIAGGGYGWNHPQPHRRVALVGLPPSEDHLRRVMNDLQEVTGWAGALFLLYGPADLPEARTVLSGIIPDRDSLKQVYLALGALVRKGEEAEVDLSGIAEAAGRGGRVGDAARDGDAGFAGRAGLGAGQVSNFTPEAVISALNIFQELGLLQWSGVEGSGTGWSGTKALPQVTVALTPSPQKADLESSETFRAGMVQRREVEDWWRFLLTETPDLIARYLGSLGGGLSFAPAGE